MDRYLNDLKQIAQDGELAILVGSKLPYNPWEITKQEILNFLATADPNWQPYLQEIRDRKVPTEAFFRLLYQHMGEQVLLLLQRIQHQTPYLIHNQLASLVQNKRVSWLGICNIDNRLPAALQDLKLQEGKDYYQKSSLNSPHVVWLHGDLNNPSALKTSLDITENRYSGLSAEAQAFFKALQKTKAVLVIAMDQNEYCWREIYGKLLSSAKQNLPIYWASNEKTIPLQHLMGISKGGLLPIQSEELLAALLQSVGQVTGSDKANLATPDLTALKGAIKEWIATVKDVDWFHFLAILLKYIVSSSHAYTLFEELANIYQQSKKHAKTALCHRSMGEILAGQGCVEKAIKAHTSAMEYWAMVKDEANMAQESVLVGDNYCSGSSFDKAVQYYGEGLSLHRYRNNAQGMLDVTSKLALLCEEDGDFELAKRYYLESLQASRDCKNTAGEIRILLHLSNTLIKDKDWEKAKKYLQEATTLCEQEEEIFYLGEIYQHLGLIYMNSQDYPAARQYYEKAYEIYIKEEEKLSLTFVYCNLGHVCARLSDYDAAVKYYEGAVESYEKMGDWQHLAAVYNNLGLINSNRQNYELAEDYFSKAAEIFAALQDVYNLIRAYNNLARVYTLQEELENAAECYRANIEMLLQLGEQEDLASTLVALAMIQLKTQQLQSAINHLQQAANLYEALGMKQEREETLQIIQTLENGIATKNI